MLRKGSSTTNIIGIGNTSTGNNTSSSTSSPYHQPHHHPLRSQRQQHFRTSSTNRESHSQLRYQNHHQRINSSSTPPTSCTLEGACTTTSPFPKRGSHSQSTGDITVSSGDSKSPVRHNQSHCCGCSCGANQSSSSQNTIARGTKASTKSVSESLLQHVVTSSGTSPSVGSPKQQQPLLCSTNHSVVSSNSINRDCPADSHPKLTTKLNHNSGTINNKLWLFGSKDEEDDDEICDEDDEGDGVGEDERRGQRAPPVTRSRRHVCSASGGGGVGTQVDSTSNHAYSSGQQPNPSPIIVAATVPCQYQFHQNLVGGGNSSFYNNAAGTAPGAIFTSTPIGTNQAGLFNKVQSSACSSSNLSIPPPTNQVVASELLLPMDFIQVLIHQHAKTIVALQDLQREVSTLKDFRTSLLHSLPATGAPPPVPGSNGLSEVWKTGGANSGGAVGVSPTTSTAHPTPSASSGAGGAAGTSTAPKIPHPDSGFSTETKSTNQKSDAESDDELYSLLSLIQCKVQESIIRNDYLLSSHHTSRTGPVGAQGGGPASTSRTRRKSDNASGGKPKDRLGKLDKVLGNCDKVEFRKDFISRDVIRGVLGAEKTELQRQLFFALVKIENLKSLSKEQKTIDSRVHALSQENEQLRYKLKEMEIELEGTKATLRILQKTSYSPSATLRISKSSSSSTSVLPEAACHLATNPSPITHSSHHYHNQSSNPTNSRLAVPVIPATPTWENDSLDENNTDFAIPGATTTSVVPSSQAAVGASASAHSSSSSTATRQRLIQKLSDIESSSSSVVSSPSNNNSTIRLSSNNSSSTNNNNYTNYGSNSKKSPAPKPPVIIEHTTSTTTSPPTSNNNNNNNTVKQQKSASPVGNKSMSSIKSNNSSIPIAVSRLKGGKASGTSSSNGSSPNTSVAHSSGGGKTLSGKVKTGNNSSNGGMGSGAGGNSENNGNGTFWANWFRS